MKRYLLPKTAQTKLLEIIKKKNFSKKQQENLYTIYSYMVEKIIYNKRERNISHRGFPSKELKGLLSRYYNYTEILVDYNFLHKINYYKQKGQVAKYDLTFSYYGDDFEYVYLDETITSPDSEIIYTLHQNRELKPYKYLLNHFKKLEFDYDGYMVFCKKKIEEGKITQSQLDCYNYSATKIYNRDFFFKKPKTDKRLHTNLTNAPKDLRRFVKHDGEFLVNLDFKNSQPFFLAVILKIILEKNLIALSKMKPIIAKVQSRKASEAYNYFIRIQELFNEEFTDDEIKEMNIFIESAKSGKFYELLVDKLEFKRNDENILYKQKYSKEKRRHIVELYNESESDYENRRSFAKSTALQVFFASAKSTHSDATQMKKLFPAVWKVTKILKDKHSSNFAALLQNIESYIILDVCCKKIYKELKAPMFTIHDSIATTLKYAEIAQKVILEETEKMTGISPIIGLEEWKKPF